MDMAYNFIFDGDNNVLDYIDNLDSITNRPKTFKERRHYFDDVDFCTRFRLSKKSALDVLGLTEDKLEYPSDRNESIAFDIKILCNWFATDNSWRLYWDQQINLSQNNTQGYRCNSFTKQAIYKVPRYRARDCDSEAKIRFYNIARFPKAVGALDCTHIRLRSPGGQTAEYFRNRKGYMSTNVQAIGSANLKIVDLVARWPGSSQDQTIWNASYRNALFENNRYGDSYILADSGYMKRPYVMMPLENPRTPEEILYNESQIRSMIVSMI
ncbi:unnamed protein product [Plutella xylostella]|uniref:(diamondback moth) hypothetical protein n=1 Tax=Plutella xylostella TaxID=51655 RepID=A0A8S4GCN5_PLUXY|nr:unnamed protein product [Plutella xylostella]